MNPSFFKVSNWQEYIEWALGITPKSKEEQFLHEIFEYVTRTNLLYTLSLSQIISMLMHNELYVSEESVLLLCIKFVINLLIKKYKSSLEALRISDTATTSNTSESHISSANSSDTHLNTQNTSVQDVETVNELQNDIKELSDSNLNQVATESAKNSIIEESLSITNTGSSERPSTTDTQGIISSTNTISKINSSTTVTTASDGKNKPEETHGIYVETKTGLETVINEFKQLLASLSNFNGLQLLKKCSKCDEILKMLISTELIHHIRFSLIHPEVLRQWINPVGLIPNDLLLEAYRSQFIRNVHGYSNIDVFACNDIVNLLYSDEELIYTAEERTTSRKYIPSFLSNPGAYTRNNVTRTTYYNTCLNLCAIPTFRSVENNIYNFEVKVFSKNPSQFAIGQLIIIFVYTISYKLIIRAKVLRIQIW